MFFTVLRSRAFEKQFNKLFRKNCKLKANSHDFPAFKIFGLWLLYTSADSKRYFWPPHWKWKRVSAKNYTYQRLGTSLYVYNGEYEGFGGALNITRP